MNINSISMFKLHSAPNAYTTRKSSFNNNFVSSPAADSISFNGKNRAKKGIRALLASFGIASAMTACAPATKPVDTTPATSIEAQEETADNDSISNNNIIPGTYSLEEIDDYTRYNNFQTAQTGDIVSITHDFSKNYEYDAWQPEFRHVTISEDEDIDEKQFSSLDSILENVYHIDLDDKDNQDVIVNAYLSILKANPELLELIDHNDIDYTQGDVTNIPLDLIKSTDFTKAGDINISLPDVQMAKETGEDNDTSFVQAVYFEPVDANDDGVSVLEFSEKDFEDLTDTQILQKLNSALEENYEIPTINSYAGFDIWHAIAVYKDNYEVFEGSSESDIKNAAVNYIKENGDLTLSLPTVSVSSVTKGSTPSKLKAYTVLTRWRANTDSIKVSYLRVYDAVADMTELPEEERTLSKLLSYINMPMDEDGEIKTLLEKFEEDPDTYGAYVLSALTQLCENQNPDYLKQMIIDHRIDEAIYQAQEEKGNFLTSEEREAVIDGVTKEVPPLNMSDLDMTIDDMQIILAYDEDGNVMVNLQPVAFAYSGTGYTVPTSSSITISTPETTPKTKPETTPQIAQETIPEIKPPGSDEQPPESKPPESDEPQESDKPPGSDSSCPEEEPVIPPGETSEPDKPIEDSGSGNTDTIEPSGGSSESTEPSGGGDSGNTNEPSGGSSNDSGDDGLSGGSYNDNGIDQQG